MFIPSQGRRPRISAGLLEMVVCFNSTGQKHWISMDFSHVHTFSPEYGFLLRPLNKTCTIDRGMAQELQ